ncbi:uncharacterized protein [Eurosta solidaginis]|uniref:uncharacterized protein isoform X2 n=1 Tax=Eurosta solidaginis TaxID=178769 RepID=UPI0035310C02
MLILLMGMGLGALYMMHLLAQDYNKIRRPVSAAARALVSASNLVPRVKRETPKSITKVYMWVSQPEQSATQSSQNATSLNIDWKRILSRDPFECLQSLICQLASGAETQSHEAKLLLEFVEATVDMAPATIQRAFSKGLVFRGSTDRCYHEYPFCVYSAKTMIRVLRWFAEATIDDET